MLGLHGSMCCSNGNLVENPIGPRPKRIPHSYRNLEHKAKDGLPRNVSNYQYLNSVHQLNNGERGGGCCAGWESELS